MGIEKRLQEASRRHGYPEDYSDWRELCSEALNAIYTLKNKLTAAEAATALSQAEGAQTDVLLGFASFQDGTFELVVQNKATGDECMLTGPMTMPLEKIDKVLPTCVYVPAKVSRALPTRPREQDGAVRMPAGLSIKADDDGTWLCFKASTGRSAMCRLEYLSESYLTSSAIKEWCADYRTALAAPPLPAASFQAGAEAMREAAAKVAETPCSYCAGVYTGLPGNACENCMNTRLRYRDGDEIAVAIRELPIPASSEGR